MKRRTLLLAAATGVAAGAARAAAPAGYGAPLVELYVPAGVLSLEQKAAAIKGFTEVISNALGLAPGPGRPLFMTIVETAEGGFGVNGQVFTPRR